MKKIFVFAGMLLSLQLLSQPYPVTGVTITLPANPDANIANWKNGTSMLTISATGRMINGAVDGRVKESRILVVIKKNGAVTCGSFNNASAPASNFNSASKVWSGNNAVSLLGQECSLPPGDYELCVQFFGEGAAPIPLSEQKCKAFSIKAKEDLRYQPPQPLQPLNASSVTREDAKKSITFRWTPVLPRPVDPIIYKLHIWQVQQNMPIAQVVRTIQPIITKEVNNLTQAMITNLSTDCPPPCALAWNVQALNRDGKPVGENNGTGETFSLTIGSKEQPSAIQLISPANGATLPATQQLKFEWLPPAPAPEEGSYKIKIVEITGDQSPENAFRTNKPFFEKDSPVHHFRTNKPFFEKDSISRIVIDYPSSAPKFITGKTYAWQVQVLDRNGKATGKNNGTSDVWKFSMGTPGNCNIRIDSVTYTCKGYNADGKPVYGFKIYVKNNATSGVTNLGNTFSTDPNNGNAIPPAQNGTYLNVFPPAGGVVSNLSPAVNVLTTIAPGAQQVITGDYTLSNSSNRCLIFKVFASTFITSGTSVTGNSCSSMKDTCLTACVCKDCDAVSATFNLNAGPLNNNQVTIGGNITVNTPVYGIEVQVMSHNFTATPPACTNGVTNIEQSAMILMPGTSINGQAVILYNETLSGLSNNNASKTIKLLSSAPLSGSIPVNILLGLPGPLPGLDPGCCKMKYNVCFKIKVFTGKTGCNSCSFTHCMNFTNQ